ncbi:MAG: pitrilysin family protein [Candidatus Omnitrophica bacterium]|nr:pitrilysin family protein [Candidatus Omnitrophota bacterium]MDD4012673.1 pitrilysin family protein [Candidatus Omnitrophota bacterium]
MSNLLCVRLQRSAKYTAVAVILLVSSGNCPSHAQTRKAVLSNGSRVVIRTVPGSALATIQMRALSGLSNEGEYAGSGISHFLEHLIFKGSAGQTTDELIDSIKSIGGVFNGSTGLDSAEYTITVPKENYVRAMEILTGMVMRPEISDADISSEKEVILNEIRMRDDDPQSIQMDLLFEEAFIASPYRYKIIGAEERLMSLTETDLRSYHSAAYSPERIVLAIVGDVNADEALLAAENIMADYSRSKMLWLPQAPAEPKQLTPREKRIQADVNLAYITMGFHTTSLYSQDLYAGDVLSWILGGGRSSRLYRRLVDDKELLFSVGSFNNTPRYDGIFVVSGVGSPTKIDDALTEIYSAIDEVAANGVSGKELEKAKRLTMAEYYRTHMLPEDIASSISLSEAFTADPDFLSGYSHRIELVTQDDVKRFAESYLKVDNSTVIITAPRNTSVPENTAEVLGEAPMKAVTLPNGLEVCAIRVGVQPLFTAVLLVRGGLLAETLNNNGISALTSELLLRGSRGISGNEQIELIENAGGVITPISGTNSMGVSVSLMESGFSLALDTLYNIVTQPIFPDDEFAASKQKLLASISEQKDDVFATALNSLRSEIFPDEVLGMDPLGTEQTVASITRDDIVEHYKKYFVPGRAVLVVAGSVDPEKTVVEIEKRFSSWKAGVHGSLQVKKTRGGIVREREIHLKKNQSMILKGYKTVPASDDRKYALSVLGSIMSGSDGSLFSALRTSDPLTYFSGAISMTGSESGYFAVFAATSEEGLVKTRSGIDLVLRSIRDGSIGEEEVEASKRRLITEHLETALSDQNMAMTAALDRLYGLGFDHYKEYTGKIGSVSIADIVQVAEEMLRPEEEVTVTVHSSPQGD